MFEAFEIYAASVEEIVTMSDAVCIVGSGLSGYLCMRALRDAGCTRPIQLFTEQEGDFYSKPMLSAALAQKKCPDDLVTLSKSEMESKSSMEVFAYTTVKRIDRSAKQLVLEDGRAFVYGDLILAVGASPINLQLPGSGRVQTINHLSEYRSLHQTLKSGANIVVLGGGLVGTEFACDFAAAGHSVHVVHDQSYPVNQLLPQAIGSVLQQSIAEQLGVVWHTACKAARIEASEEQQEIVLDNGTTLHADVVISAVGLTPNTALAKDAGLIVNRGIVVDRQAKTSDPHIYALGDCAEVDGQVHFYVPRLRECAEVIAGNLMGQAKSVQYPASPVILKTPPCRVAVCPPPCGTEGAWKVEGEGMDLEAVFYDQNDQPKGCAFSGKALANRPKWMGLMPDLF